MAVIMTWTLTAWPVHRRKVATVVEGHQRESRLASRIVQREVSRGAGNRAAPLAVDLDQPDAGRLQPAQDLLGLLGGGGRGRAGGGPHGLGRGPQLADELVGVG